MESPGAGAPFRLVSIPLSHYCERARWALDRAGVPYREDGYLPIVHGAYALRAGGGHSVPVLASRAGVFRDSADILRYADAFVPAEHALFFRASDVRRADVEALTARIDVELGPATRCFTYFHVLPHEETSFRMIAGSIRAPEGAGGARPWWLGRGVFRGYFPVARALMRRVMHIDAASAARSLDRVRAVFDVVGERLRDGRPFLAGDRFSAADLTFAALATPVLWPEGHPVPLPSLDELPAALRDVILALRAEPAGAFGLRMYREQRWRKAGDEGDG